MTEIQRVVDELRFLLQREVVEQTDELAGLVREYSAHCHAANLRLRRGDECLKQGLRSEALHLAEAAPNLLDVIAVLDFPERDQLLEVVSMYFFTPPEPLLLDVASALNEAYAEQEPLQKLLDAHRLLALGRAPLPQRLSVLRSLASLDAASPHWETDVREMERARLHEVEAESRTAASQRDAGQLKTLLTELQSDGWREPVPAALLRELKSRAGQTVRGNARQRMEELNDELYAAFSALDAARARPLREEWDQKQKSVQAAEHDPLREQVAPVFDWLDDEDRRREDEQAYSRAVAGIERGLDNEQLTAADLRKLGVAVDRLERSLPESLQHRYHHRLTSLDVTEARQRKLKIGAFVAAVALVAGVFGFAVYTSNEGEKTRRLVAAVTEFIDDGKLEEARKFMEQQPASASSPSWLAVRKSLSDAEQAEHDRVIRWKAEIETITQSTEAVRIEAALKLARELSRTADEKVEVGKLQSTWQKRVREDLAGREKLFREQIALTSQALQSLDRALGEPDSHEEATLVGMVSEAESRLNPLRTARATVAKELGSQAELLDARLAASRKTLADLGRKSELLNKLTAASLIVPGTTDATTKAGAFEAALREFATALPNDPRTATFKAAAEASPLPSFLARRQLLDRWRKLCPADALDAAARMREVRSYLMSHPQSPDRELMGRYEAWLASIQRRFADDGDPDEGALRRMKALFNSKFIKDGHTLRDTAGNTYYLTEKRIEPFGNVASFKHLIGFNGETRLHTLKPAELTGYKTEPPPQQKIASDVRILIDKIGLDDWPKSLREVVESLLKENHIDPFLRYLLVLKTLELASLGDRMLELELVPVLEKLSDDDIDRSVAWMDPFNKSAEKSRTRANELLAAMPPLEPIFERAAERQKQFERDFFAPRFSIGWLEKTSRGEWVCRSKWTPTGDHVLHAVSRPDASGVRTWQTLGQVRNKTLSVDPAVAQAVGEATLVFASFATTETKTAQLP